MNSTIDLVNQIADSLKAGDLDDLWNLHDKVLNWYAEKDAMINLIMASIMTIERRDKTENVQNKIKN